MKRLIPIILLFLLIASSAWAKNLYVDKDSIGGACSDSTTYAANDITHPWCTGSKAATSVLAGDVINFRTGTFDETVTWTVAGTSGSHITVRNYGSEVVTFDSNNTKTYGFLFSGGGAAEYYDIIGLNFREFTAEGIMVNGKSHITFTSVNSSYNTGVVGGIYLVSPASYITVDQSTLSNNNSGTGYGAGLYIGPGVSYVTVTNMIGGGNAFIDVYAEGGTSSRITHLKIDGLISTGTGYYAVKTQWTDYLHVKNVTTYSGASGIQIETGTRYFIVEDNITYNNGFGFNYECGIWIDEGQYGLVQNNTSYGNQQGVCATQSHYTIFRKNKVYNNKAQYVQSSCTAACRAFSGALHLSCGHVEHVGAPYGLTYNSFYNNVFHNDGDSTSTIGGYEIHLTGCANMLHNRFINNIIMDTTGQREATVTDVDAFDSINYNLYYNSAKALKMKWNTTDYTSLATWQAASGQDTNSISVDPLFADKANNVFTLLSGSPAINSGRFLTVTVGSGSGTSMIIADPYVFSDGFGIIEAVGDTIQLEGQTATAIITDINYTINTLTLDTSLTWTNGQGVALTYFGTTPDIGAYEYNATSPMMRGGASISGGASIR